MLANRLTDRVHQEGGHGSLTLVLARDYLSEGTNGTLLLYGEAVCHTIELPWRDNRRNVSCIPEGCYRILPYRSRKFGPCLIVDEVPRRSGILFHPANHAATELKGCIAPVTKHTGRGRGIHSRIALERLVAVVMPVLEAGEPVWLDVRSIHDEAVMTRPMPVLAPLSVAA